MGRHGIYHPPARYGPCPFPQRDRFRLLLTFAHCGAWLTCAAMIGWVLVLSLSLPH